MKTTIIIAIAVIAVAFFFIVWRARFVAKAKKKRKEEWDNMIKLAMANAEKQRRMEEEDRRLHYHEHVNAIAPYIGKKGTMASDIIIFTSKGRIKKRSVVDIIVDKIEEGKVFYTEYREDSSTYSFSMEVWMFYEKMLGGEITY